MSTLQLDPKVSLVSIGRLAVYPGVGHGINVLKPQWCVEQIQEFLQ